nr:hypothetical protein [Tanacetum cinerariifolium]
MDLFAFINHADLTKVRIGGREGDVNAQGAGNDDVNEEDDEAQTIVADKSKRIRKKRKAADGAGGYGLPPKKLREYHSASGDAGASTTRKSLVVLQGLLDSCTLAADVGLTAAATVPFVTSSMIPHTGVTHAANDEVTFIVRSSMPPTSVLTAVVATTIIADITSAPAPMAGTGQIYILKWNVTNDSALDDPDIFHGVIDHLAPPAFFLIFIAWTMNNYLLNLMLDAEATEVIRLCVQVAVVEAVVAARIAELNDLKEHAAALGGRVASLDSATVAKDAELSSLTANTAQVTHDLSSLKMSFGEVTIKAASLESEKDDLVGHVSALETTYFGLREQVSGYELFKEQIEDVQDEQVKILSNKVADIDVDLMKMALHLDEEFYPHGLAAGIDHGRAGRDLAEVASYNPIAEADYVFAVSVLRDVDFHLLAQLASHKDASMSDLMDLLSLEGPTVETPEAIQLQPSLEQLMLPIHRLEDQWAKLPDIFCMADIIVLVDKVPRSRLISKALSFCTMSISAVLKVGIPISVVMTAFVL